MFVARYWIGVELPADAEEAEAEAGHAKTVESNQCQQPIHGEPLQSRPLHEVYGAPIHGLVSG